MIIVRNVNIGIVEFIDEEEERGRKERTESLHSLMITDIQQKCLDMKVSLTYYLFILPLLSISLISFSIYKLNMTMNLLLFSIHIAILLVIFYIVRYRITTKHIRKTKKINKNKSKENTKDVVENNNEVK